MPDPAYRTVVVGTGACGAGADAHRVMGSHPAEDTVRTIAVMGSPVEALLDVVRTT